MINALRMPALLLCCGLATACPDGASAFNDVTATSGGVAAGRDVNIGVSPEQVKELTEAAARGATGPLTAAIVDLSKKLGVTEDATRTLLRIVGEQDVPLEHLSETLGRVAKDYKRLQAQAAALNPENPTAKHLVARAKAEIEAGLLEHAHELLRQATQAQIAAAREARQLREQAQAAEDKQMLGAASSTATEGGVALTERHYAQAAELFGQAAAYVPAGHSEERLGYLDRQADALFRQGDERGDNDALQNSIQIYHRELEGRTRDRVPLDWAMTQMNLGDALMTLGEREAGTSLLEEAGAAYHAALEEFTRERMTLDVARAQRGIGIVLSTLGEREAGTALLEAAVDAYRAALEELTRERVPLDWAMTQRNLGHTLKILGDREAGTARLEQAVDAYRAALEELTRERVPLGWATTQNNLGTALNALGGREAGTVRLEQAVDAYRAALEELTRERVPLSWAATQNNLGLVLVQIWTKGRAQANARAFMGLVSQPVDMVRLEQAVDAYRAALQELTRERMPLGWATTQMNLGNALTSLGEQGSGTAYLQQAVDAYRAALEEFTRERVPLKWATTQMNLGNVLLELGDRTRQRDQLVAALACFRSAMSVYRETNLAEIMADLAFSIETTKNVLWQLTESMDRR